MLATIEFEIPGRPTAWARTGGNPGADGGGVRRFTPHKQRKAMQTVQRMFQAATANLNYSKLSGPLRLEVLCVYAIPVSWPKAQQRAARLGLVWKTSTPDWDNLGQLVSDALNHLAYGDDSQIVRAGVAKRYGYPERTVIRVAELPNWQDALAATESPDPQGALSGI
jgi:Holliday junction resolvase RusA-like endonuclease